MRQSKEAKWSLSKLYESNNSSYASTERFFQTLRKQSTKLKFTSNDPKQKTIVFQQRQKKPQRRIVLKSRRCNLELKEKINEKHKQKEAKQEKRSLSFEHKTRFNNKKGQSNRTHQQVNNIIIERSKQIFRKVLNIQGLIPQSLSLIPAQIELIIEQTNLLPLDHQHFNEFYQSILEMMKLSHQQLLAINLFVIILGFQSMDLPLEQLSSVFKIQKDKTSEIIQLSNEQVKQMNSLYSILNQDKSIKEQSNLPCQQNHLIISITLPNKSKEQNIFSNKQNFTEIVGSLMSKYSIPQKKRKNMEKILLTKLNQKKLL